MTEIKVDNVQNAAGSGKPNFPVSPTHSAGSALSTLNTFSYTSSATAPSSPKNGALWWDSGNDKVKVYIAGEFKEIELNASSSSGIAWGGDRGVFAGGYGQSGATWSANIDYIDITSAANAQDFGDLTSGRTTGAGMSNSARGVFMGGSSSAGAQNFIDYITISTTGNATDFGDCIFEVYYSAGASDATKGYCAGGARGAAGSYAYINNIQYVTIDTAGNATDGGNLTITRTSAAGWNDATRAVVMAGTTTGGANQNSIDYYTMSTSGNATDFGDLTTTVWAIPAGAGDATYALCAGGRRSNSSNANGWSEAIDRITIQSTGNATDFGDLQTFKSNLAGASNGTKATFAGGDTNNGSNIRTDQIDLVTVATPGNATDFGNLTVGKEGFVGSTSGAAS